MNIRQIIAEAIDKTIMAKYSESLKWCLGSTGIIDTTPLGNNTTAVKFVNSLSNFAMQVRDAINTNNYKPATAGSTTTTRQTQQLIKPQANNKSERGLIDKTVNWMADTTNDAYQYARQAGFSALDPVVGGVVTSFQNGYNMGREKLDPANYQKNQQPQPQQQPQQKTTTRRRPQRTGIDLTTLMGQDYRTVLTNYNQVNQLNPGLLNRIPNVGNVIRILADIKNALSQS